jgi:hypothetical protein
MKGNTLDATVTAVDKLPDDYLVSPEYKESTNCRFEGQYGFTKAENSALWLVYVVMQEHNHTRSQPYFVGNWLGGMIDAVSVME